MASNVLGFMARIFGTGGSLVGQKGPLKDPEAGCCPILGIDLPGGYGMCGIMP